MVNVKPNLAANLTFKCPPSRLAIADSGCTDHFVPTTKDVGNPKEATRPLVIQNPNRLSMVSTHTGKIHIPGVPNKGYLAHVVPDLHADPLLSIGKFCDAGCNILFTKEKVDIITNGSIQCSGKWSADGL